MIYEPAEDSFLLEKCIKKYAKNKRVLDMGSGSGILARAAFNAGAQEVTAVDIDKESIVKLKKEKFKVIQSDMFAKVGGSFDLIVCNPPYLPEDIREDRESARITAGGKEGDEFILKFLEEAREYLAENGTILVLLSSLTPQKKINELLKKMKMTKKVIASEKVFMEMLEVWEVKKI